MNYSAWLPWYNKILNDFGYSKAKDEFAARVLAKLLSPKLKVTIKELEKLIRDKNVYVFGAANSLKLGINKTHRSEKDVFISADSATSLLINDNKIPDIIVTDLDGNIKDLLRANEKGSIAIIHAHGDNIEILKKYVGKFKGKVIGTTQASPFDGIYNFGGFTDGDRAVFLAEHFKAKKIFLVGFDFKKVGELCKGKKRRLKLKKLKWAEKLITALRSRCKSNLEILCYLY
ncbi:MAG: DUF115 domain-containing protein [Candidatus Thermoplasmatota archaeon]|nr:DUF115 domain-containing protein [Candidatus Thermoplasmatota archaeon]